jgi:hypothetical protein
MTMKTNEPQAKEEPFVNTTSCSGLQNTAVLSRNPKLAIKAKNDG